MLMFPSVKLPNMIGVLTACLLLAIVSGCSGGNTGTQPAAGTNIGTAAFVVDWPTRGRVLPKVAESIELTFTGLANSPTGRVVNRPTAGAHTTETFTDLPSGTLSYTLTAYPLANKGGIAVGTATGTIVITAGQVATVTVSAVMSSTIDHVTLSSTATNVYFVGQSVAVTATAYNSTEQVVLVTADAYNWSSAIPAVATVQATSGQVSGISAGTTTITATERESGKHGTTSMTFNVVSPGAHLATVSVGGPPSSVGINPVTNRIYVAAGLTTSDTAYVCVYDGVTNTRLAAVSLGVSGAVAMAVNTVTNRVYLINGSTVSVFDGNANTVLATIPVGNTGAGTALCPGIAVNSTTNRIYAANSIDGTVSVIDGSSHLVLATIPVGNRPTGIVVDTATNEIFVANTSSGSLSIINGSTNAVVETLTIGCKEMVMNPATHRIYLHDASYPDKLRVLDSIAHTVIAEKEIGSYPRMACNSTTDILYIYYGGITLFTVYSGQSLTSLATLTGPAGPVAIAVNSTTNKVYVITNFWSNNTLNVFQGY